MKNNFPGGLSGIVLAVFLLSETSQAAPPVITAQPQPATVTTGQQVQFTVSYTSTCGAVRPRWQFIGVNVSNGTVYSGATAGTLTVNATAAQAGSYRVVLTCGNGGGSAISNAANLTVRATGTVTTLPPMISTLGLSGCPRSRCVISWNGVNGPINATKLTITQMRGRPVDVTGLPQTMVAPKESTIYTLTASNSAGTYSRNVFVPVGSYTATISSCGAITKPGRYLITSSISSSSKRAPCLDVRNTDNVYIDCSPGVRISGVGGEPISSGLLSTSGAINFTNVNGFAVRDCRVEMSAQGSGWFFASFTNSSMGYVFHTTYGNPALNMLQEIQTYQSNYITLASDIIYNGIDLHDNSTGLSLASCTIKNTNTTTGTYTPANVFEWGGGVSGTTVINSTLDGGATAPGIGADDGIVASGDNEQYVHNLLKNYWDAGIEWISQSGSNTIYENTFQNAGLGAINFNRQGTLTDSIVSQNYFDMTGNFQPVGGYAYGIYFSSYAPAGATLYFQNNNFNNNNIINGTYSGATQFITGAAVGGSWVVGNNVFYDNNFNYNNYAGIAAPVFTMPYLPGIVTDLGGNVCAHPNPPGYLLVCH